MSISIRIDMSEASGKLEILMNNCENVEPLVQTEFPKALDTLVSVAQEKAPLGTTGNLRDSIRWEGDYPEYAFIADPKDKYGGGYAYYVEFGTSRRKATPFMWPAIEIVIPDFVDSICVAIKDALLGGWRY